MRHDPLSTGGIHEVVEGNNAGDLLIVGIFPPDCCGASLGIIVFKRNGEGTCLLEDFDSNRLRTSKKNVVEVGTSLIGAHQGDIHGVGVKPTYNIPGPIFRAHLHKVCI